MKKKMGKRCHIMSELNKQHFVFVCSHILKLSRADCVHTKPHKGNQSQAWDTPPSN